MKIPGGDGRDVGQSCRHAGLTIPVSAPSHHGAVCPQRQGVVTPSRHGDHAGKTGGHVGLPTEVTSPGHHRAVRADRESVLESCGHGDGIRQIRRRGEIGHVSIRLDTSILPHHQRVPEPGCDGLHVLPAESLGIPQGVGETAVSVIPVRIFTGGSVAANSPGPGFGIVGIIPVPLFQGHGVKGSGGNFVDAVVGIKKGPLIAAPGAVVGRGIENA